MTFALTDIAFYAQAVLAGQDRQAAFYSTAMMTVNCFEFICLLASTRG
jgi:hypothetical protein